MTNQDKIAERLVDALGRLAPESGANRSGWYNRLAEAAGVKPDAVRKWLYGENAPSGPALCLLFDHLGHDFERQVRGHLPGKDGEGEEQARIDKALKHLHLAMSALDAPAKVTRLPVGVAK